jgi:chaperone modulatory protein CbpM
MRQLSPAGPVEERILAAWVEAGWLRPDAPGRAFSALSLARADLIQDLFALGINEEGVPVILDLVDQLHGMRRALRNLLVTLASQPESTRYSIGASLNAASRPDP